MYTLPHQVEFLSDAWVQAAERYLTREVAQRKHRLGGQPFSISERFTHAPPHLKLDGDVGAWHARYDGDRASVGRGFVADADLTIEGDYQAALMTAQFVGLRAPNGMRAMNRELTNVFGRDAMKVKGELASDGARDLLADLHDHMARRTVENPDLAHRAARQGLTGKIREMEERGYTVLERAISGEFADEVRAATLRALHAHSATTLNWMLYHGPEFERLAQNPQLMTLVDASLGRGAVIASFSAIRRGPGPGSIPIHTDYAHVPEPYPEFAMTGVGVWALEDWTAASGPTWIVPGSHRMRRAPREGDSREGAVPIEMPKGSVVYFTQGVWHWQGDRTEPGERVTLHWHFNRGILRSLEPKKVDPQLLHRNAPRLGEMLGEDDWFDKMSASGRDHVRLLHMGRLLAFNEKQRRVILDGAAESSAIAAG
ncbi:MAG TPA: phytanoyl-CoA dioxygenase family protein [Pseudomonadales bacterium]|nr:phytanoyl-CoA dioxygenase family protein [Pseudomonadales bacterium]